MNKRGKLPAALFLLLSIFPLFGGENALMDEKTAWTPPKYAKVVGYRFRVPGEDSKEPIPSGFSLLKNGTLDAAQLKRLALKSVELHPEHIRSLITDVNAKEPTLPAACYDPHHIFVFYADSGAAVAAIEVCFSCNGIRALPDIAEPRWYRHDFVGFAKLTDDLGLWLEHRTVKEWISLQSERNAPK